MTYAHKQPSATEQDLRRLLLSHLREMRDVARVCESICGEIVGEPWATFREMVATNAGRVEQLHDFVAGTPL